MNSFNLNRFCKTFHWFFSMNLRSLLMWTGGFTVTIFLAGMMVFFFNPNNPKAALGLVSTFDIIFIFIGLFASVSSFTLPRLFPINPPAILVNTSTDSPFKPYS